MTLRLLMCLLSSVSLGLGTTCLAFAQHANHRTGEDVVTVGETHPAGEAEQSQAVDVEVNHAAHSDSGHGSEHGSEHSELIGLSHGRHASGTAWMPDSTPMYMDMWERGRWQLMLHGAAHLTHIQMNGPRGDSGVYGPNWLMYRGMRPDGCDGQLEFSTMLSLDPFTVGGAGYPLLFQSGETWNDEPLRDHQHPHNVFSELALKYKWRLACDRAAYLYVAPVGEPALGPPAFMHRQLALDHPLSPIGHHWQDATHIAYGVVTAGVQSREWQLEGSVFNGQEPGENRFAIDDPTFDSFSGRVTWNPGKNLSLQVSRGELNEPEPTHPGEDVTRTSASLIYNHDLGCDRSWQTALVWGRNSTDADDFDSYLIESSLKQDGGWSPYFRYEWAEKNAEELVLPDPPFEHHDTFAVQQGTVGLSVDLGEKGDWQWGLGGAYIFNFSPSELAPVYGSNPDGWNIYLRAHPRRMKHVAGEHGSDMSHAGEEAHVEAGQEATHPPAAPARLPAATAPDTDHEQHAAEQQRAAPEPHSSTPDSDSHDNH